MHSFNPHASDVGEYTLSFSPVFCVCVFTPREVPSIEGRSSSPQDTDVRQAPIHLIVIKPIPHDKQVIHLEPHVLGLVRHLPPTGLVQQRANLDARRAKPGKMLHQARRRPPRVHNVLNLHNV